MTNANLHDFFLFRHTEQGIFSHDEFEKNFSNSKKCGSKSKARDKDLLRGKANFSRAEYKLVHYHLSVLSRALWCVPFFSTTSLKNSSIRTRLRFYFFIGIVGIKKNRNRISGQLQTILLSGIKRNKVREIVR